MGGLRGLKAIFFFGGGVGLQPLTPPVCATTFSLELKAMWNKT